MLRRRSQDEREHGQIIVLFALCLVVILAFTAIVVDIGMLRNDRQNLANAMDAGALAGGTVLPVSGQNNNPNADGTTYYQRAVDLIDATVKVDYPGLTLPTIANGGITFRCLIGTLPNGTPDYSQITAGVCNPSNALGHAPGAGFPNDFTGAGPNPIVHLPAVQLHRAQRQQGRHMQRRPHLRRRDPGLRLRAGHRHQLRLDRNCPVGGLQRTLRGISGHPRRPRHHP